MGNRTSLGHKLEQYTVIELNDGESGTRRTIIGHVELKEGELLYLSELVYSSNKDRFPLRPGNYKIEEKEVTIDLPSASILGTATVRWCYKAIRQHSF